MISRVFKLPAGSYIFCRSADFRELEGFSHKLFAAEEIEFDLRLNRLARHRGQQIHIIRRPPLLSSNRRMVMYSPFRLLWFLIVSTFTAGFNLRRGKRVTGGTMANVNVVGAATDPSHSNAVVLPKA